LADYGILFCVATLEEILGMSLETETLLRTILYQLKMTDDIEDAREAVEVMCSEETVAYVEKKAAQSKTRKETKK
jgi:hypothetical protein